ncbi:MAG: hypothetical protein RR945_11325 [Erysipelotrichaceae bacterium]
MIKFASYIISEKQLKSLNSESSNMRDRFIAIREKNNEVCEILKKEYINGYISLKTNGKEMLGVKYWDDINCLWMYFVNALEDIILNKLDISEFYFPDQPVKVIILNMGLYLELFIDDIKYNLNKEDFINAIRLGAQEFFETHLELTGNDKFKYQLEKISKLFPNI